MRLYVALNLRNLDWYLALGCGVLILLGCHTKFCSNNQEMKTKALFVVLSAV